MKKRLLASALACPPALLLAWSAIPAPSAAGQDPMPPAAKAPAEGRAPAAAWTTAVVPKPLSKEVKRGLDWLVEHQFPDGGWGQGEESSHMRGGGTRVPAAGVSSRREAGEVQDTANVADTCIAALALLRSGSTPREGPYRDAIVKAVRFVREQVEGSASQSLSVSEVRGTRVHAKLGPNIDTFLASMLLAEVRGRMPEADSQRAVDLALAKVLDKIQRHQKADGSFEGSGWAPVLAQAMCGKGINRARQAGARVAEVTLARADLGAKAGVSGVTTSPTGVGGGGLAVSTFALAPVDRAAGARPGGDAGVELYRRSASLGVLQDSTNTSKALAAGLREQAAHARDAGDRDKAKQKLAEIDATEKLGERARSEVVSRLADDRFVAGFGSNGGEEFLSYMTIAESLVVKGGEDWKAWDAKMTGNLVRVQDGDGSWSGHHCITGRTFCTATALLVLMADRTPVPVEAEGAARPAAR